MDQSLRNKLRGVVTQSRKLLEEAVAQVLQGQFGIYATGKKDEVAVEDAAGLGDLSADDRAFREQILVHLKHVQATGFAPQDKPTSPALVQMVREVAFTHLNRLCAYKMMEVRGLIREAVSRGLKSNGFLYYLGSDGHEAEERLHASGQQFAAYRHFLEWLGGTLSEEIGVLFSPHDPANRLFPPQRVLEDVLEQINDPELKGIWSEDEAIGWAYQYFTPKEQRDEARKASAAPRNSYELAFRNQFFTPRYVVEFLTDNTLGRIWYEMRKGDTALMDRCRYMIRRPNEVFLSDGEAAPAESPATDDGATRPIAIPFRAKKDPRELKILDPACGSGHFLLYCFDLLLLIYLEAYDDPDLGPALKLDYASPEEFKRAIPGLILSRNLHGIDIDLRASQIAALALWLRAQRAYVEFAMPKAERPKVTRSNFVCAEPMPGEQDMLEEFLKELYPAVLGQLVRIVFDRMKLAGEAGSLLKIEAEIQGAVEEAHRQWLAEREQATDQKGNPLLFTRGEMNRLSKKPQTASMFDILEISEQQFWADAEGKVVEALRDFARRAANGKGLHRQLFAEDAARGFAFVDVCRKRFDVVLMNPPFGAAPSTVVEYQRSNYEGAHNDTLASFVVRGLGLCGNGGLVGAITSRSCLVGRRLGVFREQWMLRGLEVLLDLGKEVMDDAMVQSCAYVVANDDRTFFTAFDARSTMPEERNQDTLLTEGRRVSSSEIQLLPYSRLLYSVPSEVHRLLQSTTRFEPEWGTAREGMKSFLNDRFLRLKWEPPLDQIGQNRRWRWFVKGGDAVPYRADIALLLDWGEDGKSLKEVNLAINGSTAQVCQASVLWFRSGCTYSRRSQRGFYVRLLPAGCIFSDKGPAILPEPTISPWLLLGFLNSDIVRALVHLQANDADFLTGIIKKLPVPELPEQVALAIEDAARKLVQLKSRVDSDRETDSCFAPFFGDTLARMQQQRIDHIELYDQHRGSLEKAASDSIRNAFHLVDTKWIIDLLSDDEDDSASSTDDDDSDNTTTSSVAQDVLSFAIGCGVGRWDVTRVNSATTEADYLATPDVCSPAFLKGSDGLPATNFHSTYPLRVQWDGMLVDDPDHVNDIVRRAREVLELIWKDRADAIEKEACEILGVKELRDYFRKPGKGGFWDDHIARYSKSRRKAPIYWLLQSSKKSYAIWLYCHRLDKDTLYKVLVNTVGPKVKNAERELLDMRTRRTTATGKDIKALDRQIEKQDALVSELRDFEDKLRRAAELNLTPDLNDGVVLTIAPLRELVPWKEAKAYWEELLAGEYAWSSIGKQLREKGLVK